MLNCKMHVGNSDQTLTLNSRANLWIMFCEVCLCVCP